MEDRQKKVQKVIAERKKKVEKQKKNITGMVMISIIVCAIIIMARKTAANPDAYYLDLRVRLSVGCKRRFYFFFLYLPVFSYLRL